MGPRRPYLQRIRKSLVRSRMAAFATKSWSLSQIVKCPLCKKVWAAKNMQMTIGKQRRKMTNGGTRKERVSMRGREFPCILGSHPPAHTLWQEVCVPSHLGSKQPISLLYGHAIYWWSFRPDPILMLQWKVIVLTWDFLVLILYLETFGWLASWQWISDSQTELAPMGKNRTVQWAAVLFLTRPTFNKARITL